MQPGALASLGRTGVAIPQAGGSLGLRRIKRLPGRILRRRLSSFALDGKGGTMANAESCVTIHMAASLDGFIARKDGSVDWLETSDEFAGGATMDPGFVEAFLKTIDCYVMGSRTY